MLNVSIKFDAAIERAAQQKLKAATEKVHKVLADCLNEVATVWLAQVKRRMPVDTGKAKRQVHAVLATPASLMAAVGSDIDYVAKLEFGSPYVARGQVIGWLPGDPAITECFARAWVRRAITAGRIAKMSSCRRFVVRLRRSSSLWCSESSGFPMILPQFSRGRWRVATKEQGQADGRRG